MEEEYTIGQVRGFQVTGKDFYSMVFDKFEDAVALKKKMEESKGKEKVIPMTVSKEVKKNVKK
jgi:hypothetical protein